MKAIVALFLILSNVITADALQVATTESIKQNKNSSNTVDLQIPSEDLSSKTGYSVPVSPFLLKLAINDSTNKTINDNLLLNITRDHLHQEYQEYFRFQLDSVVLKSSPFPSSEQKKEQYVFRGFANFKFPPLPEAAILDQLTYAAFESEKKSFYLESLRAYRDEFSMVEDVQVIILGIVESLPTSPPQSVPEAPSNDNGPLIGLIIAFLMVVIVSFALIGTLFYIINKRSRSNAPIKDKNMSHVKNNSAPSTPTKSSFPDQELIVTPKTHYSFSSYSSVDSSMSNSTNQKYTFSLNDDDSFHFSDNASFSITSIKDDYPPNSHTIDIASIQQMSEFSEGRFDAMLNNDYQQEKKNEDAFECENRIWNDAELPSFELTEDSDSYLDAQSYSTDDKSADPKV